jgi:DNA-binding response OmpR family regulator
VVDLAPGIPGAVAPGAGGPILVVDDEVDLLGSYERLLRRQGYRVISASSLGAGLYAVRAEPLSLVITDLRFPDGDGLDVVRAARASATPTPVIVVTGFPTREARRAALGAGATAFVAKPFSTAELSGLVQGLVPPGVSP